MEDFPLKNKLVNIKRLEVIKMFGKKIKKILAIEGMSCNHCAKRIESSLLAFKQVKSIKVDLDSKEATIVLTADIDNQTLKEKIDSLGFNLLEVKNI